MAAFSKRRLLYVVVALVLATVCLWLISSSSTVTIGGSLVQKRMWGTHTEILGQLVSLDVQKDVLPVKKYFEPAGVYSDSNYQKLFTVSGPYGQVERRKEDSETQVAETKLRTDFQRQLATSMESPTVATEGKVLTFEDDDQATLDSEVGDQEMESSSQNNNIIDSTDLSSSKGEDAPNSAVESMLLAVLTHLKDTKEDRLSQTFEVLDVNVTSPKIKDFIKDVPPPSNLPWNKKQLLVSSKDIYKRQWVQDLQHFLQYSYDPAYPVTLVSTNQLFVESVINWLIHSLVVLKNPLKNVLVLTMDQGVYEFLRNRSINTICVPAASNVNIDKPKKMMLMVRVEAARLLVLRMLNHWGIDVINYDNDAIVLKNPQPLLDAFRMYDVIGSEGFMPYEIHEKWGVALCFGFFLLRATQSTKKLWDVMCSLDVNDDQKKFNFALSSMELQWHNHSSSSQFWQGHTRHHNLSVAVFPITKMCRSSECNPGKIDQYYIWHKGGGHKYSAMVKGSQKVNLWLVKPEWRQISGEGKTTEEWLRSVANLGG